MQSLTLDLTKTPEIADAVADMEPGDEVCLHATIKSLDAQTLVVTVEELSVPKEEEEKDDKLPEGGNEGSSGASVEAPGAGASAMLGDDAVV
jgi:hypothetical protein